MKSVRFRSSLLLENASLLQNFDVQEEKLDEVASLIVDLIKRDYASPSDIPPHSRWRHFEASVKPQPKIDRISPLLAKWKAGESVRRLLDLFVVGVLLDAGAGSSWTYTPVGETQSYNRSEGLGIASFDLFVSGVLSSSKSNVHQCDSKGLSAITPQALGKAFQRLGGVLEKHPEFFKSPNGNTFRPGNLLDYLLAHATKHHDSMQYHVDIDVLWHVVMQGFSGVWPPTRTVLDGIALGDVWPCKAMKDIAQLPSKPLAKYPGSEEFVCFHKLSQWLTYSLMEPLALANVVFDGVEKMTGLAEYRNGGLFVDTQVITLKKHVLDRVPAGSVPRFEVWDDVIVEWRALTVALLDKVAGLVRTKLNMDATELTLAKILEAGILRVGNRRDMEGWP
ncbi:hypothetical protein HDU91_004752 [Kappamyces sp. JEL0680]|nr:hypothetical protein HDU91_004752 [Kappamyces sp. JEL0680]